jgi:hypothetical protein
MLSQTADNDNVSLLIAANRSMLRGYSKWQLHTLCTTKLPIEYHVNGFESAPKAAQAKSK